LHLALLSLYSAHSQLSPHLHIQDEVNCKSRTIGSSGLISSFRSLVCMRYLSLLIMSVQACHNYSYRGISQFQSFLNSSPAPLITIATLVLSGTNCLASRDTAADSLGLSAL
jgi:hypothetical protein